MDFKNLAEITEFIEMFKTDRAEKVAEVIKNDVKLCSKVYYIYDEKQKIWKPTDNDGFLSYMHKFMNKTMHKIKALTGGLKDKRIDELMKDLEKGSYLKDLLERLNGDLRDDEFIHKLNHLKQWLPIRDGKKINLKTKEIEDRKKEDYFASYCDVGLVKTTKNADKFFSQLMPKKKQREYFRKCLGYWISGNTDAQCFFVLYGSGSNGKSKISDVMDKILSQFYVVCADEVFSDTKADGKPSPHLAELFLRRCGFYSEGETADDMNISEKNLKRISGQDKIKARNLFQGLFQFFSDVKLVMLTNFTPPLNAEKAMKRRIRYIFFDSVFSDDPQEGEFLRDDKFVNQIMNEYLDEVFTWIVDGSVEYFKDKKIEPPEEWQQRTNKILESDDSIATFIKRFITRTDNEKVSIRKKDLFDRYSKFCDANSQRCNKRSTFYNRLDHLNFTTGTIKGYDVYRGMVCSYSLDACLFKNKNTSEDEDGEEEDYDLKDEIEYLKKKTNNLEEIQSILTEERDRIKKDYDKLLKLYYERENEVDNNDDPTKKKYIIVDLDEQEINGSIDDLKSMFD